MRLAGLSSLIALAAPLLLACSASTPSARSTPEESPEIASLTQEQLARPWATLAVPSTGPLGSPRVVQTPTGFVALAHEQSGGKAIQATHHYLYQSDDGVTWHRRPFPAADNPTVSVADLAYGAGRFAAAWVDGAVTTSTDLVEWSPLEPARATPQLGYRRLLRIESRFFNLGVNDVSFSSDGLAWTRQDIPLLQGHALAFGNGVYVLAGARAIHSSSDLSTWQDRTPSCDAPGASCVVDPGGERHAGPYANAVFFEGRFYVDHLTSTDGGSWEAHGDPVASVAVGGHLFNVERDSPDAGVRLRAFRPGEAAQTIAVEPAVALAPLANGVGPETLHAPLPGGETCRTHRCVLLDGAIYLIR